jgi:uncharacterized protein (TIGR02246 family)
MWLVLVVGMISCAGGAKPLSEKDVAAIRGSTDTYAKAVAARDMKGLGSHYTEDAKLLPPNGPMVQGRAAIESFFSKFPPIAAFTSNAVEVEGRGDLAVVRGTFHVTMTPPGAPPAKSSGKYIEVRRKQKDGKWPIAVDIFNSDQPPPKPEAPPMPAPPQPGAPQPPMPPAPSPSK